MRNLIVTLCCIIFLGNALASNSMRESYTLKNGLKVILVKRSNIAHLYAGLYINSGYAMNKSSNVEAAHFTEHFQGMRIIKSNNVKSGKIRMVRISVQEMMTRYLLSSSREGLGTMLQVLSSAFKPMLISKSEINHEIKLIQLEKRLLKYRKPVRQTNPYYRYYKLSKKARKGILLYDPFQSFSHMTNQKVMQWHMANYIPNNAVLIIMGDFNFSSVKKEINHYFSLFQKGIMPKPKIRYAHKLNFGFKLYTAVSASGSNIISLDLALPKPFNKKKINYKLAAINLLMRCFVDPDIRFGFLFIEVSHPSVFTYIKTKKVPDISSIMRFIEKVKSSLMQISDNELKVIKNNIIKNWHLTQDDPDRYFKYIGFLENNKLTQKEMKNILDEMKYVTVGDIRANTKKYYLKKNIIAVVLQSKKNNIYIKKSRLSHFNIG